MPRQRERLQSKQEGNLFFVRFRHPIRKKVVCIGLGDETEHAMNLAALNRIWMDPAQWLNPLPENSRMREAWLGPDKVVKLLGNRVEQGGEEKPTNATETAKLLAKITGLNNEVLRLTGIIDQQARELEHWRGKKTQAKDYAKLGDACEAWLKLYAGKDPDHAKNVAWDVRRFVKVFGADTRIDMLVGKETEIRAWLDGLKRLEVKKIDGKAQRVESQIPLSAGRRFQIRTYVVKMLTESGIDLDLSKLKAPTNKKILEDRRSGNGGRIRFLELSEAKAIAAKLPAYWQAAFRLQVALGLRPSELITLHRENFKPDLSELHLAAREHLTLKTGSRTFEAIPEDVRVIIRERLQHNDLLFPQYANPKAREKRRRVVRLWEHEKTFGRQFTKALRTAAKEAGIAKRMDARIGRRTCASLLRADNVAVDRIAALLGNSAKQIIEAYGDPSKKTLPISDRAK